jgi:acetyl esterase/lipase
MLGLSRKTILHGNVRGEWVTPPDARAGVIFYVHGGGFVACSSATHRPIAAGLARITRMRVFSVDYRLAPEARLPSALDDVAAAYAWVTESARPGELALVGDSAGGNLVLGLALRLRGAGREQPACVVGFSPWTDLAGTSPSVQVNDGRDAMFHTDNIRDFARAALGEGPADSPVVSPVYADLHGLPPVLLHVGSTELLLDDSRRVHEGILGGKGRSTLTVYNDVPHCWQMLAPLVPEATTSLREAAAFIAAAIAKSP